MDRLENQAHKHQDRKNTKEHESVRKPAEVETE